MATIDKEPRRCPRCGARVAQQAQSCLLCGQDLRSSGYLQPALALVAVAIVAGAVIAGLRDRTLKSEASPRPVTNTPPPATVLAQAPAPTVEETEPGLALEAATVSTATPVPPTPTVTPVPTDTDTPTPAPTDTATPTPGPRVHVVQAGDVLGSIALEYDLELDELLAANPGLTERSLLRLGQEIVIPAKAASAEAPASEAPAEAAAPKVHVIESGDNLLYLAEKYGGHGSADPGCEPRPHRAQHPSPGAGGHHPHAGAGGVSADARPRADCYPGASVHRALHREWRYAGLPGQQVRHHGG